MDTCFEKIILGGDISSLAYAFKTGLPLILTDPQPPFIFDYLSQDISFEEIGLAETICWKSNSGDVVYGPNKLQIWQKLMFLLSLSGKIIYGDTARSVTIEDNILSISLDGVKSKTIGFDSLIVFSDKNVIGLDSFTKTINKKNIVYDWVNIKSGGTHDYDVFLFDNDFVKEVFFYPSERNKNTKQKDLVAVSYLTDEELIDFSFSDTYVKFKLLEDFKLLGIRGARNGRDPRNPDRYKYYAVKLEPANRVVKKMSYNLYENTDRVIFNYQTFEEILNMPTLTNGYLNKVCNFL